MPYFIVLATIKAIFSDFFQKQMRGTDSEKERSKKDHVHNVSETVEPNF